MAPPRRRSRRLSWAGSRAAESLPARAIGRLGLLPIGIGLVDLRRALRGSTQRRTPARGTDSDLARALGPRAMPFVLIAIGLYTLADSPTDSVGALP